MNNMMLKSFRRPARYSLFLCLSLTLALALSHCGKPGKDQPAGVPQSPAEAAAPTPTPSPAPPAVVVQTPAPPAPATTPVPPTPSPTPQVPPAVLKPIENLSEVPPGSWSTGTWDDYLLENGVLRCVFGGPKAPKDDPFRSGALLDFCREATQHDYLLALMPVHGKGLGINLKTIGMSAGPESTKLAAKSKAAKGKIADIVIEQESLEIKGLRVHTRYSLEEGSDSLLISSVWDNQTSQALKGLEMGNVLQWNGVSGFLPGVGVLTPAKSIEGESDFLAALGPSDTFILAPATGRMQVKAANGVINATIQKADLAAGAKVKVESRFFIGGRDMGVVSEKAYKYEKIKYGWLIGRLTEVDRGADGKIIVLGTIPQGEIQVLTGKRDGKLQGALPYVRTYSNAQGDFAIAVPEGTWHLRANAFGYILPDPVFGVDVKPGESAARDLTVGPASRLQIRVVDSATSAPIPCKVTVESMINTQPIDFGPPDNLHGANVCYLPTGEDSIVLPAGNYRITVTHGIEYDSVEKIMRIRPKQMVPLEVSLRRTIPTEGWIAADFGVKTTATRGCLVSPGDRVAAAAAEGVEYLVTGDDNIATDLSGAIRQLGLESKIRSAPGLKVRELTKNTLGELLLFPAPAGASAPAARTGVSDKDFFAQLRAIAPGSLLTVSRPSFPDVGYYTLGGWTKNNQVVPSSSDFYHDFDLIEVWEGKRAGARVETLPLYHAELQAGRHWAPLALTNSAGLMREETGYPRTYIKVSQNDPSKVSDKEIIESLRAGRVVLTNGPFVDFKVQGQGPGSMVQPGKDKKVLVQMKVWAPNWVSTYSYQLDQNGGFLRTILHPGFGVTEPLRFPRPENQDKQVQEVVCTQDCVLSCVVVGSRPLSPVVSGFAPGEQGQVYPYAISGPVYVDADGDGRCTPPAKSNSQPANEEVVD